MNESTNCLLCQSSQHSPFIVAEDDLTGKPGKFEFVRCDSCGLVYQNPRIAVSHIKYYYDDDYVAHREKSKWGPLYSFVRWVLGKHDRDKLKIVENSVAQPLNENSRVLDIGCATGAFLTALNSKTNSVISGVDFKDTIDSNLKPKMQFHCGLFLDPKYQPEKFDLITMWHYLEHDYDPLATLQKARSLLKDNGRLVIEVPNLKSLSFRLFGKRWPGLQAPQHMSLFDPEHLQKFLEKAGFHVVAQKPFGSFPKFFYFYTGFIFQFTRGRGINLNKHVIPYMIGGLIFSLIGWIDRFFSLSMMTFVAKKNA